MYFMQINKTASLREHSTFKGMNRWMDECMNGKGRQAAYKTN